MIDQDLERIKAILRKEATGYASFAEQDELYALVNKYTGKAMGLPWPALLQVAQYGVRLLSSDEEMGQGQAA